MAETDSFNRTHLLNPELKSPAKPNPCKSYSASLFKALFVLLLLVLLPLFPSQAPEFINQTILNRFWELIHLLFIGIAVSYGLFGRRNAKMENEIHPKLDNSQTYFSGILHISSIFENGYENPYGSDEKRMIQTLNPQFLESELKKPRSLIFQKDLEIPPLGEKNVSQTWNSQYFHGESMVFVSQENCALDEWGEKPNLIVDYKPLGLPIRSLRSRIEEQDIPESIKGNGSSSDSKGFCVNSDESRNGKFRGLTPINLDEKFKETVSLPSPIPWGSRSSRIVVKENVSTDFPSVGELESDNLKSQSFWSPIFSQTSPMPSPAISKEIPHSKMENFEGKKISIGMKARGFSIGSSSEMDVQKNCDAKLKDFSCRSMREDPLGRGKWGVDSWKNEGKPKSPLKPFPRGRSVRTIRASENDLEERKMGEICSDHVESKVGKKTDCDEFEARQNLDDDFPLKESSKLSKHQNGEINDFVETNEVESEKESESEFEKFQVSSDDDDQEEEAQSDIANDAEEAQSDIANGDGELDPDEVDRKADEFIAKFREQIRLQKIASNKGFSGW